MHRQALLPFLLWPLSVVAAETPLIGNVDGRRTSGLSGPWRTIVDPLESGYYDYRYRPRADGFFRNDKARGESDRVEYDFDASPTLEVPGDWNTQRESLLYYEGTLWYKTTFDDPRREQVSRLFVWFGAVNQRARVWLNGTALGQHEGGFTPFNFELTDGLRPRGNVLVVQADSARRREAVPALNADWWNYGGITRRVLLVELPETFIEDYLVQLAKGSPGRLAGWVKLNGPKATQKLTLRIAEAGVAHTVTTGADGYAAFSFPAELTLWSPEDPRLYELEIAAETDTVREAVGFRTIETRGGEILLNGRPVFLRGVSAHEEAPLRSGRAFGPQDARTLLGWVKELHGNFIRLAHYPHNALMAREADRMGLLVWSEIPVYWTILWENEATLENALGQLAESISRDKNRASVVLWSVGNETPIGEARNAFLGRLIARARALDPTRLVTAALERRSLDERTQLIDDPLGRQLDVLGCNEYVGWYDGLPDKCDRVQWMSAHEKPLVMSEWGGAARAGLHGGPLTRWSEEYQEHLYQRQVAMLKRIAFLRGSAPWILMDFRSPRRVLPGVQDGWNRKGIVSDRGDRKKAFYVLQGWYREIEAANGGAPPAAASR